MELKTDDKRVDLWLEHDPTRWPCPKCSIELAAFDHVEERTWRHLDTCQFQTLLHAEIPRVQCPTHGVKQVRVPWAEARSRFTLLMERLVIDLILQCGTVKGACAIAAISWDEAWGIMQRAVARGQRRNAVRPMEYIGVDEKVVRRPSVPHDRLRLEASSRRCAPFRQASITNGVAEGLNSKIMSIKRKAGGFRNPSNFTTAFYFHCGGLGLYPR